MLPRIAVPVLLLSSWWWLICTNRMQFCWPNIGNPQLAKRCEDFEFSLYRTNHVLWSRLIETRQFVFLTSDFGICVKPNLRAIVVIKFDLSYILFELCPIMILTAFETSWTALSNAFQNLPIDLTRNPFVKESWHCLLSSAHLCWSIFIKRR